MQAGSKSVTRVIDQRLMAGREGRWRWYWALLGNGVFVLLFLGFGGGLFYLIELWPALAAAMAVEAADAPLFRPGKPETYVFFVVFAAMVVVPVVLTMKGVHGWSVGRVLGPRGRFAWPDFARAAAAWAVVFVVATIAEYIIFPERYVIRAIGVAYALWFALAALVILPQAFAEDFLFNGYLGRIWGAIVPVPLIVVPAIALVFSLLHTQNADVAVDPWFSLVLLFAGQALALMVYFRTQSLGATVGLHWINNVVAMAVVATLPGFRNELAPIVYRDPVLLAGGSHTSEPLSWLSAVAAFGILWLLLMSPRSPFHIPPHLSKDTLSRTQGDGYDRDDARER